MQDLDEQAIMDSMKKDLSTNELAAMHSQFNTAKKHNPDMKADYEGMGKKEKGKAALGWYLSKVSGGRFQTSTVTVGSQLRAIKTEEWLSEKEAQDRFGKDLDPHVESGRVIYRESPGTKGVWEYQDTQKVRVEKSSSRAKPGSRGRREPQMRKIREMLMRFSTVFCKTRLTLARFWTLVMLGFGRAREKEERAQVWFWATQRGKAAAKAVQVGS